MHVSERLVEEAQRRTHDLQLQLSEVDLYACDCVWMDGWMDGWMDFRLNVNTKLHPYINI